MIVLVTYFLHYIPQYLTMLDNLPFFLSSSLYLLQLYLGEEEEEEERILLQSLNVIELHNVASSSSLLFIQKNILFILVFGKSFIRYFSFCSFSKDIYLSYYNLCLKIYKQHQFSRNTTIFPN